MGCLVGILVMVFFGIILWAFSESVVFGIILLIAFFWVGFYLAGKDNEKQLSKRNEKINKRFELQNKVEKENFKVSQKYDSDDLTSSILLDEERKKVCFIFAEYNITEIYDYKDILESEIMEDGKTITNTSRSSQLGGALVGGLIAGGTGAVIGGLSGKKSSEQEITKIDLKVIVNNTKSPIKKINFLTVDPDINGKPLPIKKDNPKYKSAIRNINHWHSILSLLIKQTDSVVENTMNNSIADELKKLAQLKQEGILSEEEFIQQKQKLLS